MLRPGPVLAVVCCSWLLLRASAALPAAAAAGAPQDDGASTRREPAGERDGDRRGRAPAAAVRVLDSRQLTLGGLFIGPVELPDSRPLPATAPSHEEMKAAVTPPEFRTPPAVSFGFSWRSRR